MRTRWKILAALLLAAFAWGYFFFFTGTPVFGSRLNMKDTPVVSIEFTMTELNRITNSSICSQVVAVLGQARGGGPPHFCPALGSLTIHYADGTTNEFHLMPGHGFDRLDLVFSSGSYSISRSEMFGTLRRVGLLHERERK